MQQYHQQQQHKETQKENKISDCGGGDERHKNDGAKASSSLADRLKRVPMPLSASIMSLQQQQQQQQHSHPTGEKRVEFRIGNTKLKGPKSSSQSSGGGGGGGGSRPIVPKSALKRFQIDSHR